MKEEGLEREAVLCLKGSERIAAAIGVGRNEILELMRSEGLPVWRRRKRGPWLALPEDLRSWLRQQREKYMQSGIC